jgi:hypothetical protein
MNVKASATAENNGNLSIVSLNDFTELQCQPSAHFKALFTYKPMVVNLVFVSEGHKVRINVNNIFAVHWNAILSLILLADTFRKQPVQNGKVNVYGLEFPAVEPQVLSG